MALALLLTSAASLAFADENVKLTADFSAAKTEVSPNLFGIFYEDINYAADGGLYGEMIQNRSFEFRNSNKSPTESWNNVNLKGKKFKSKLRAKKDSPLNENNPIYAHLEVSQKGDGISNSGYSGLFLEEGKNYPGSVYLRSPDGKIKSVTIVVGEEEKQSKGIVGFFKRLFGKNKNVETIKIKGITNEWRKFTFNVKAKTTTQNGKLSIYADKNGELDIDFVSLFRADIYKNETNGLREDLALKLEELHPAFIRFPGGCIVHGLNLADRYQWKDTIGPVEERKENSNFWGYQQSYGLGFYEYFRFCEDINAEPLPVISCGMAHSGEISPVSDYELYAQDALDLIEYATGPADSTWGKKRAEAGHPEPFKLHYLGIGNEDCGKDYFDRFKYIAERVKAKYPEIKTIISSGYTYNDINFHNTWNQVRKWESESQTENLTDLIDEHYYNPYSWFLSNGSRYDNLDFYPRGEGQPKVFIGEYASWDDNRKNSLYAALTEAAYMTSIERNGDIIEISSYAPLFARDGKTQWVPDMIWFNETSVYATPDYYVQQLFMTHKSDRTVKSNITQPVSNKPREFIGGTTGLGTWATTAEFKDVKLTDRTHNSVLYDSNSVSEPFSAFRKETGDWENSGNSIIQKNRGENIRAILDLEDKMQNVDKYTFEVNAKKTGGDEGFLIMFGVKGKNLYWWNMGGWGNTQSVIEKGTATGRATLGEATAMTLETNVWYNIRIEVDGESYKCYLDGKLIHSYTDVKNFDEMFSHVGETNDGKVLVKIVNVSENSRTVDIALNNVGFLSDKGEAVTISGEQYDENSFSDPKKVSPKTKQFDGVSENFSYTVPPYSATVLTLQKK